MTSSAFLRLVMGVAGKVLLISVLFVTVLVCQSFWQVHQLETFCEFTAPGTSIAQVRMDAQVAGLSVTRKPNLDIVGRRTWITLAWCDVHYDERGNVVHLNFSSE